MSKFIRYDYKIGDKVIINFNPCNETCNCFWTSKKASFLQKNVVYEIEYITEFGGGCPPELLQLKGVQQTYENNVWGVPANWFKPV